MPKCKTSRHHLSARSISSSSSGKCWCAFRNMGLVMARPSFLKANCVPHCKAPLSFDASPGLIFPVRNASLMRVDHFPTFPGAGQKVSPSSSTSTWTPNTIRGFPASSLCFATAVLPKHARTSLKCSTEMCPEQRSVSQTNPPGQAVHRRLRCQCVLWGEEIVHVPEAWYVKKPTGEAAKHAAWKRSSHASQGMCKRGTRNHSPIRSQLCTEATDPNGIPMCLAS